MLTIKAVAEFLLRQQYIPENIRKADSSENLKLLFLQLHTKGSNSYMIMHHCFISRLNIPQKFHVSPMTNIASDFDLGSITKMVTKVSPKYSTFSELVTMANRTLTQNNKRLANEF